jgi:hypothetical protein
VNDVSHNRGHGYVRNGKRGGIKMVELISGSVS